MSYHLVLDVGKEIMICHLGKEEAIVERAMIVRDMLLTIARRKWKAERGKIYIGEDEGSRNVSICEKYNSRFGKEELQELVRRLNTFPNVQRYRFEAAKKKVKT